MLKYKPKASRPTLKVVKPVSDDPGKLGNLECRKHVYAFLSGEKQRPISTKDADMVPELVEIVGEPPADIDEVADVYVWAVLTLVDQGRLSLPSLAYKAWCCQPRVKLVRAFMNSVKTEIVEEDE